MKGCVQVYTGNGKGKTTAAVGLALRAVGAGHRVFIGQFMKAEPSAEIRILLERCPEVEAEQFGTGRFIRNDSTAEDIEAARKGLARLQDILADNQHDVVVADEANNAVHEGLLSVDSLLDLIGRKPPAIELVFTGRNADPRLVERADLVTEMCNRKHYFKDGVPAREGFEY